MPVLWPPCFCPYRRALRARNSPIARTTEAARGPPGCPAKALGAAISAREGGAAASPHKAPRTMISVQKALPSVRMPACGRVVRASAFVLHFRKPIAHRCLPFRVSCCILSHSLQHARVNEVNDNGCFA